MGRASGTTVRRGAAAQRASAQVAAQLRELVTASGEDIRVLRCDGGPDDLRRYKQTLREAVDDQTSVATRVGGPKTVTRDEFIGWKVRGDARVGDLLLSIYGEHRKYAVDLAPVTHVLKKPHGVTEGVLYDVDRDVIIAPLLPMELVYPRMKQPLRPRWWAPLAGERARDLLEALAVGVEQRHDLGDVEARKLTGECAKFCRSAANREAALLAAHGKCAGCDLVWGRHFGDYALDVHHRQPLGRVPRTQMKVVTKLSDLIVLCPTCHRLIHKRMDEPDPLDALRTELKVFFAVD